MHPSNRSVNNRADPQQLIKDELQSRPVGDFTYQRQVARESFQSHCEQQSGPAAAHQRRVTKQADWGPYLSTTSITSLHQFINHQRHVHGSLSPTSSPAAHQRRTTKQAKLGTFKTAHKCNQRTVTPKRPIPNTDWDMG